MKFTFGFFNGVCWLIISTMDELIFASRHMNMTQRDLSVYIEAFSQDKVIYLNENGGYHTGERKNIHTDKTQIIVKDNYSFPTKMDRVEVMKAELLVDLNEIQRELGLPLSKRIVL